VVVSAWIVTLFVGANAGLLWVADWLLSR